jgi:hypothetical protein
MPSSFGLSAACDLPIKEMHYAYLNKFKFLTVNIVLVLCKSRQLHFFLHIEIKILSISNKHQTVSTNI